MPKYNPTYLKNDLRKSKGIIAGKTIGTYKPNRELIEKLDAQFCDLILKDETIISDDRIIPKIFMGHRTKRILRIERKEYQTY